VTGKLASEPVQLQPTADAGLRVFIHIAAATIPFAALAIVNISKPSGTQGQRQDLNHVYGKRDEHIVAWPIPTLTAGKSGGGTA
jgi:hypothetical protein